jgi:WD40 repeat protein
VRTAFLTVALAILVAAPARADIFAVAPVAAQGHADTDVGLIDLSTDTRLTLPASVNTGAVEDHPSISQDGRRIAFERIDPAAGTDRIIAADTVTGQAMDLFDAFETAMLHPHSPAIARDGTYVTAGTGGHALQMRGLDGFPNGVTVGASGDGADFPGALLDPTPTFILGFGTVAYRRTVQSPAGPLGVVVVEDAPGDSSATTPRLVRPGAFQTTHPTISGRTLVYAVQAVGPTTAIGQGDIAFCELGLVSDGDPCVSGRGILPPLVSNPLLTESCPAFTPDGRYLAFIRREASEHERLYLFDTQTQTLLDPDGSDLGAHVSLDSCNVGLYPTPLFTLARLPSPGVLQLDLTSPSRVGLLVQRVVGHHRLLGRRVPKLRPAGRIPLGAFRRGRHTVHWRAHLRPGRYQFTPRALTRSGRVRDLGTPRILKVR